MTKDQNYSLLPYAIVLGLGIVIFIAIFLKPIRPDEFHIKGSPTVQVTDSPILHSNTNASTGSHSTLPKSYLLAVPFTTQAPTANWDELHNEACEEASAIMTAAYFAGDSRKTIPASEVEKQIAEITEYFTGKYGYYLDTNQAETAEMIETKYGLKTKILDSFTKEDIKQALVEEKIVIMNFDGKLLDNPNFRNGGPPYHMLVITGYEGDTFITNDPGTRKGQGYKYSWNTLYAAAGDWDHAAHRADKNAKRIMIVSE